MDTMNDELLEGDFDMVDGAYELALEDEDALLEENEPTPSSPHPPEMPNSVERNACDDQEDFIDIRAEDDSFHLDDDKSDEDLTSRGRSLVHDEDTDDEKESERSRFRTERKISLTPRKSNMIPETLDGLVPVKVTGFQRNNKRRVPILNSHKGNRYMKSKYDQGKFHGSLQEVRIDDQSAYHQIPHSTASHIRQAQHNIHLNPHFRPRGPPFNQPVWPLGPQPNYGQPFYNNQFNYNQAPAQGRPSWNEGLPFHPGPPPDTPPFSNFDNQFYNGGFTQEPPPPPPPPFFFGPQGGGEGGYPHGPPPSGPPPLIPPSWNGGGTGVGAGGPPPPQPLFPTQPPFSRFSSPQPPHQPQRNFQRSSQIKNRLGVKRDRGAPFSKGRGLFKRIEARSHVSSNLHEVQTVDNIPQSVINYLTPPKAVSKPTSEQPAEEEDEEMRSYRLKIEEQKRKREELWRQKEQKRLEALLKNQEQAKLDGTDGPDPNLPLDQQFRVVRVRTKDGKTILRKLTLEALQKLKKISPADSTTSTPVEVGEVTAMAKPLEIKTRIVSITNLSASTTQKQLLDMGKMVGAVKSIKLDSLTKSATMSFETPESATSFLQKFQRKMVDLSMISVSLVAESEDTNAAAE